MKVDDIDKSNLHGVIQMTPDQFAQGFAVSENIEFSHDFSRIVVSGMGGSALPVDVLLCYLRDLHINDEKTIRIGIYQNRTYTLPPEAYDHSLNIFCSHSGNTEETISSFEEALANKLPCIGISAGGHIEQICLENNIPHIKLPLLQEGFQPRMATGHFFAAILNLLIIAKKIPNNRKLIENDLVPYLKSTMEKNEKYGKELAQKLIGKTPIIYASDKFRSLAMIWKIKINENSKMPAFWNYFSELDHNEFVGFTNPQAKFYVMMLKDPNGHPRDLLRYTLTADAIKRKDVETNIITMEGHNTLEKLFWTICLGDWLSYYLALANKKDPTPVIMVEDLKKALSKEH